MSVTRYSHRRKAQHGATLVYLILALVGLIGFTSVGLDVALMYATRQRAQSVSDAAALAAAAQLPNLPNATAAANAVIAANNTGNTTFVTTHILFTGAANAFVTLDNGTKEYVGSGYGVYVYGYMDAPLTFASFIGFRPVSTDGKIDNVSAAVNSTAIYQPQGIYSLPVGSSVMPWLLTGDVPTSTNATTQFVSLLTTTRPALNGYQPIANQQTLTVTTSQSTGNFAPMTFSGGATAYTSAVAGTSTSVYMVGQTPAPIVVDSGGSGDASTTQSAVQARLASSNTAFTHNFSTYTDWFFGRSTYPVDNSFPPVVDNGATYYYYQDPDRQEQTDARFVVIPLVGSGVNAPVNQITAFSVFFIESAFNDGSSNVVTGRFIGTSILTATGTPTTPDAGGTAPNSSGTAPNAILVH